MTNCRSSPASSSSSNVATGSRWRRDGVGVAVRCVHKTLDDYFRALGDAGFTRLPELKELLATEEHLAYEAVPGAPIAE